jgi:hypothetical protein
LTIGLYLGLGGLVIVPAAALVRAVGLRGLAGGAAGGLCDTAGAAGELARWPVLLPGVVGWMVSRRMHTVRTQRGTTDWILWSD